MSAAKLIEKLRLIPHPEGGHYVETYRSRDVITTGTATGRNTSTAIYFLLKEEDVSHLHRIKSDELWFFHKGNPLEIVYIENKVLKTIILGNDIENGEMPQAMIPANTWFGSRLKHADGYALVSCTVAPGFDFQDFELAARDELLKEFPHLGEVIKAFTR